MVMNKKISLIIIVGPTASGKSELAVRIAKKYKGEIISADSRQVYRALNIGTAKIKGKWKNNFFLYKKIPHFCIDIASPKRVYTAAAFKKDAKSAIHAITARRHIPIIAGGSGFWIDALVYDIDLPDVPPDSALRKQLEKKSAARLFAILKKIDPRRAKNIEQKNPRRLIRAIEIAKTLGRVPSVMKKSPYHALWIGISRSDALLHRAITVRARAMIKQGLVAETKKLLAMGVSKKRIREFGFEYQAVLDVIEKKLPFNALVEILTRETVMYAKRQMRWFIRNKDIHWATPSQQAHKHVKKFLHSRSRTQSMIKNAAKSLKNFELRNCPTVSFPRKRESRPSLDF